jgi:hypothetical protein
MQSQWSSTMQHGNWELMPVFDDTGSEEHFILPFQLESANPWNPTHFILNLLVRSAELSEKSRPKKNR